MSNDKFKNSPIHDKKVIISMMDELEPKDMIEVVELLKSKQQKPNKQQTAVQKEFIPYELDLELKRLGFDEPCFGVYATKDGYVRKSAYDENGDAPTYSQAFRWFREKYGLDSKVEREIEGFYIGFYWTGVTWVQVGEGTYEEAELDCLKEMIKIVKNNYGKQ